VVLELVRRNRTILYVILSAALVGAASFAAGVVTGDDSSRVGLLRSQVRQLDHERDRETARASDLATQLDTQDQDITRLEAELEQAQAGGRTKTKSSTPNAARTGPRARRMGETAKVGQINVTPTSFNRIGASGDTVTYQLVVSVKNRASDDVTPFCADSGAELIDTQDRKFDPKSVIDDVSNNCEDIQPGLTLGNFKLTFSVPRSAKPKTLRLWGDLDNDAFAQIWRVG
jgi:hypothetical protein